MNKNFDVIAVGELLVDFTLNGVSNQNNAIFEACPGGAPCNVLAMLQKLNKKTAFIGRVGNDMFGNMLKRTIDEIGINSTGLAFDSKTNTTLTFVHTLSDGDREFSFYRDPGADMMLSVEDIHTELIQSAKVFHFGTLSMTSENAREATIYALELAKKNHLLISFDPNLRSPLWKSLDDARNQIKRGFQYCDILKISDNEVQFVADCEDLEEGIQYIRDEFKIPIIMLTLGKDGSVVYYKNMRIESKGFPQEKVIDTTGAGDTFCGCALSYLVDKDIHELTRTQLEEMLTFANAAASIVTTRKGAIRSMPDKEEIEELIHKSIAL